MRLIFANNYFYLRGGSERVFIEEMELLRMHSHEVAPFTRHFDKNYYSDYENFFAPHLEFENVSLLTKMSAVMNLIYSVETRKHFTELLTSFRPDIVHAHNIYGRLTSSVVDAAKASDIPVVMTLNDYKLLCPSYYLKLPDGTLCDKCKGKDFFLCAVYRCHNKGLVSSLTYTIESYLTRYYDKYAPIKYYICPSKFLMKKHEETGLFDDKLIHIPNYINSKEYVPCFTAGEYILYAGRLSKEKGILTLLRAMKKINLPLKIAGEGPMFEEYKTYINEKGIDNVYFEGYKSGTDLTDLYRKALFVIVPSEWYEVTGFVILEAFAYGKPVIAANIGGIPEVVEDRQNGLLFESGNYHDLRDKIDYLISHPSLILEMGKNARKKVEEDHDPDTHYHQLMDVYKRASA